MHACMRTLAVHAKTLTWAGASRGIETEEGEQVGQMQRLQQQHFWG